MNPDNTLNEETIDEFELENQTPSVDDFIKELEEKEKSLHISPDLVIEIDDSEIHEDNIHDSFIPLKPIEKISSENFSGAQIYGANDENDLDSQGYFQLKKKVSELENELDEKVTELKDEKNKLENKKVEFKIERDKLKESLTRRQTDFDNYRNRIEREKDEIFKTILSDLANRLLPVFDNLDRALESAKDSESETNEQNLNNFLEGIVLVNKQLSEVFTGMGIEPIDSIGEMFDPNFHEAVAGEDNEEVPPGTIIEELLKGYRIEDRVIRASMVKVAVAN